MPIEFSCKCGHKFKVDEKLAGRTGKCKHCGAAMTIPWPSAVGQPKGPPKQSDGGAPTEAVPPPLPSALISQAPPLPSASVPQETEQTRQTADSRPGRDASEAKPPSLSKVPLAVGGGVVGLVLLLTLFFANRSQHSPTIAREIEDLCDERRYAEAHALAEKYLDEGLGEFLKGTMAGTSEEELSDRMVEHGFPDVLFLRGKIELLYADYIPHVMQAEAVRSFQKAIEFDPRFETKVISLIEDHIKDSLKEAGSEKALAKQMLEKSRILMANHDYANIPNVLSGSSLGGDARRAKAGAAVGILSHFDESRAQSLRSEIDASNGDSSDSDDAERVQAAAKEAREKLVPELTESLRGLTVEGFRSWAGRDPGYIIASMRPYPLILPKGLLLAEVFQAPPYSAEEVALFKELARCYALQWSTDHVACTSDKFRWNSMIDLAMKHPEAFLAPLLDAAQVDSDLAVELLRRTPGTVHTPGMNKWVAMPDTFDAADSRKIVRTIADRYASFMIEFAAQDELNLSHFWYQEWRGPEPNYLREWLLDRDPALAETHFPHIRRGHFRPEL